MFSYCADATEEAELAVLLKLDDLAEETEEETLDIIEEAMELIDEKLDKIELLDPELPGSIPHERVPFT